MADRRMFSREIFQSSVMVRIGYDNGEFGLEAQRIFETLILKADDYGRGRFIPEILRGEAFLSVPNSFTKVTPEMIIEWVGQIEKQGAIRIYEFNGEKYYELTGWNKYQRGDWQRGESLLPGPEQLGNCSGTVTEQLGNSSGTVTEQLGNSDPTVRPKVNKIKLKKRKEKKRKEKSENFPILTDFVKEIFPNLSENELNAQVGGLEKLIRIDRERIAPEKSLSDWQSEVFSILRWMRADSEPRNGFCWSSVFNSIPPLRVSKNGRACNKFINARAQWLKAKTKGKRTVTIIDPEKGTIELS